MATATTTIAVQEVSESRRIRERYCKITISAGPDTYLTGGLTMDLTGATNPNNQPAAKFGRNPTIYSVENSTPAYVLYIVPGSNLTNWKVKIYQETGAAGALAEFGNGSAIPAAISGDTNIRFLFGAAKNL